MNKEEMETLAVEGLSNFLEDGNYKLENGKLKKRGHIQDWIKCHSAFTESMTSNYPEVVPMTISEFKECVKISLEEADWSETNFKIATVPTVALFVPDTLLRLNISVSALGDEITNSYGKNIALGDLENLLVCEAHIYNEESQRGKKWLRKPLSISAIKDFIKKEIQDRAGRHWMERREILEYRPEFIQHPDTYISAICRAFLFEGDMELNVAVIKQWLWQTKRFFLSRVVTDPLMLNLYADQGGGGKSQIAKTLCQPLEEYTATADLSAILDTREHGLFTDRFVVLFDELSLGKIEHGQIGPLMAGLRKLITEDKITQRNMRENSHSKKRRTFSPISTSNLPLTQTLPDDSGMRRFYEIEMKATYNADRINTLKAMDIESIWRGIDENLERGYIYPGSDMHKKLMDHQKNLKHRSIIDDCLENMDEVPILVNFPEAQEIQKLVDDKKTIEEICEFVEKLDLEALRVFEYRKKLKDWCDEQMGGMISKYLPGPARLPSELKSRDYFIVQLNKRDVRIIVKVEKMVGGGYV